MTSEALFPLAFFGLIFIVILIIGTCIYIYEGCSTAFRTKKKLVELKERFDTRCQAVDSMIDYLDREDMKLKQLIIGKAPKKKGKKK